MASRKWTVLLLPEDQSAIRQFRLSREMLRAAVALTLVLFAGLVSLATAALVGGAGGVSDERLLAKNEALQSELDYLAGRLHSLDDSLAHLTRKDEHYRLLAGLDPLDDDVLRAGIGGPDADSLEASALYVLDQPTGRRAFGASLQVNDLLRRASVLASSWSEAERALSSQHARLAALPSIQPTSGRVSSAFSTSRLHPLLNRPRPHMGIDIVAAIGTPVVASADGRVTAAGRRGDYGLLVEIDHGHGIVTRYAHLSRVDVRAGALVKRGHEIGAVGTSGLSAGPHLHYEVLVNGRHANPKRYLLDAAVLRD